MSRTDAVDLACELVRLDTRGGGESAAAALLAGHLEDAGLSVAVHETRPGRANVVARHGDETPVTLTGHLDTVPADEAVWSFDPLAGDVVDGRLRGRGSSDMKAGVAAAVVAAAEHVRAGGRGVQVVLTFGEETGCEGARGDPGRRADPVRDAARRRADLQPRRPRPQGRAVAGAAGHRRPGARLAARPRPQRAGRPGPRRGADPRARRVADEPDARRDDGERRDDARRRPAERRAGPRRAHRRPAPGPRRHGRRRRGHDRRARGLPRRDRAPRRAAADRHRPGAGHADGRAARGRDAGLRHLLHRRERARPPPSAAPTRSSSAPASPSRPTSPTRPPRPA